MHLMDEKVEKEENYFNFFDQLQCWKCQLSIKKLNILSSRVSLMKNGCGAVVRTFV